MALSKMKIFESTWLGLIQNKIVMTKSIPELVDWIIYLQANFNFPDKINQLLFGMLALLERKSKLFPNVESDEAKLLLTKAHLSELTM